MVPLLGPAFSIAMLGAIESLLSAVLADSMAGLTHDSSQELIGQGGINPIAGITHSLTLIATLLFLVPLAGQIPLGALAAILFVVAYNMRDLHHFLLIARSASRPESFVGSDRGHKSFMQGT